MTGPTETITTSSTSTPSPTGIAPGANVPGSAGTTGVATELRRTRTLTVADAPQLMAAFQSAGLLEPADIHTATTLGRLTGEADEQVLLAVALVVRALRLGSVCLDLRTVGASMAAVPAMSPGAASPADLPWPEPERWVERCRSSPAVAPADDARTRDGATHATAADTAAIGPAHLTPDARPLRISGALLYLERYWQQEETVRRELQARTSAAPPPLDLDRARAAVGRLFADPAGLQQDDPQRAAAAVAALSWIAVIAGGPGTGKTTTVARVLALLLDQPGPPPRIALAAPTGKAAARLIEAVRSAAAKLDRADQDRLAALEALTLHRLLGTLPNARSRFRHHSGNHLPYDVVVVDEVSMVSLTLMARLLEATGPGTRLILVGDPDQLSPVDAGAVLADVVRAPAGIRDAGEATPGARAGDDVPADEVSAGGSSRGGQTDLAGRLAAIGVTGGISSSAHGVVELTRPWRYGGGGAIDRLARAVRDNDPDTVMEVLASGSDDLVWIPADLATEWPAGLAGVADRVRSQGRRTRAAAEVGDIRAALDALDEHRLLCAHRSGPYGAARWSAEAESWLDGGRHRYTSGPEWYLGRPVLVTVNDYDLNVYNGDTGVVVQTRSGPRVAFPRGDAFSLIAPARLDDVETVHAMTVHKAQGSQFACVTLVVPAVDSPLLTREFLYTAVSRATRTVQLIGSEAAIRRAVGRPADRASGLRDRL